MSPPPQTPTSSSLDLRLAVGPPVGADSNVEPVNPTATDPDAAAAATAGLFTLAFAAAVAVAFADIC